MQWELYDPRPFAPALARTPRVRTHVQFFENADAKKYAGRPGVVFVSDIRTGERVHALSVAESNRLVAQDMAMQRTWVEIMQPAAFSLKYRLPYSDKANEVMPPVEYLAGDIRFQPWAPLSSTETRLVGGDGDWNRTAVYDPGHYEAANYYVNAMLRQWRTYRHGVPPTSVPGLDFCFDCAAEVDVWRRYETKRTRLRNGGDVPVEKIAAHINDVSALIRRDLREAFHGMFPDMTMIEKMPWLALAQKRGIPFIGPVWRPASSGQAKTRAALARMTPGERVRFMAKKAAEKNQ